MAMYKGSEGVNDSLAITVKTHLCELHMNLNSVLNGSLLAVCMRMHATFDAD